MKLLHTSDWHLGKNLEGYSRLEEQEVVLDYLVDLVNKENIQVVLIAGDIYDTANPPAKAEQLFYQTLKRMSNHGQRLIIVISGNHDNPERLVCAGPLAREHGIIMIGYPKTTIEIGQYGKHQVVAAGAGYLEIEVEKERAVILTLPYPSEKRLNDVLYEIQEEEEKKAESYGQKIGELFSQLEKHYREDTINLVVSHLFVQGSQNGGSERSIELGGTYVVDKNLLPQKAQYIALGHIHKPQVLGENLRYSGAILPFNKRESKYKNSCNIITVAPKEVPLVEVKELPNPKPIKVYRLENYQEALEVCKETSKEDSWVYLEIKTDSYMKEEEIKELKKWKDSIVAIEPILAEQEEKEEQSFHRELPMEEVIKDFYKSQFQTEMDEELYQLFLTIIRNEDDNETDSVSITGNQ